MGRWTILLQRTKQQHRGKSIWRRLLLNGRRSAQQTRRTKQKKQRQKRKKNKGRRQKKKKNKGRRQKRKKKQLQQLLLLQRSRPRKRRTPRTRRLWQNRRKKQ